MMCPHCGKSIKLDQITNLRGKGLKTEFECPNCKAWLGRNAVISRLKMITFYITLISGFCGYFYLPSRHLLIPVTIIAAIIMLVSHMMDQINVLSTPDIEDDSEQRQKYR